MQITIIHRKCSFTFLSLFYIMDDRNVIHRYNIHRYVRYMERNIAKTNLRIDFYGYIYPEGGRENGCDIKL